ncbi:MAG: sulfotransferase domain-containing protein [Actinomycetota bacterium]|nr:sulfotransferase domain-containing protein [Actinomycetota bacterium]
MSVDLRSNLAKAVRGLRRRLLRPRFTRSIRPDDVFVVTYPKSGTTWLAMMIANYLRPGEIDFTTYHHVVPDINYLQVRSGSLSRYDSSLPRRFFVTHSPFDRALKRVVYVIRDPRDVMVSYGNFWNQQHPDAKVDLTTFVREIPHYPCEWDEHVSGWMRRDDAGFLLVSYEQMTEDPAGVLTRVLSFAGLTPEEELVNAAVDATRFDRLKQLEEKWRQENPDEVAGRSEERFMRRGEAGGWRDEIDRHLVAELETRFGDVMERFGYRRSVSESAKTAEQ